MMDVYYQLLQLPYGKWTNEGYDPCKEEGNFSLFIIYRHFFHPFEIPRRINSKNIHKIKLIKEFNKKTDHYKINEKSIEFVK